MTTQWQAHIGSRPSQSSPHEPYSSHWKRASPTAENRRVKPSIAATGSSAACSGSPRQVMGSRPSTA